MRRSLTISSLSVINVGLTSDSIASSDDGSSYMKDELCDSLVSVSRSILNMFRCALLLTFEIWMNEDKLTDLGSHSYFDVISKC